tara:strand:+ start:1604 stop:2179 length:576 start_codon:yes stop_codon:yes gene_type:complete
MKSYPGKKISTAVFISGRGSNLKNLIKFSLKKFSPIKIEFVFSNNKKAVGLKYAKAKEINTLCYNNKKTPIFENYLLKVLKKKKIRFICLAGFMKILSSNFLKKFKGKIINIHPSLLPKYKGLNTHSRVIKNKENYTGCTVHFVSSKLDSGKIILQKKIKIIKKENSKNLAKRVLLQEHKIYPKAIMKIFS